MTFPSRIEFPYQFNGRFRTWLPIVPVNLYGREGRRTETIAYPDSGAAFSIFQASEADSLGLDLKSGKPRHAIAGDGRLMRCAMFRMPIEVSGYRFVAMLGFSRDLKIGFNILGLSGFFEHFREVTFQHLKRRVILTP